MPGELERYLQALAASTRPTTLPVIAARDATGMDVGYYFPHEGEVWTTSAGNYWAQVLADVPKWAAQVNEPSGTILYPDVGSFFGNGAYHTTEGYDWTPGVDGPMSDQATRFNANAVGLGGYATLPNIPMNNFANGSFTVQVWARSRPATWGGLLPALVWFPNANGFGLYADAGTRTVRFGVVSSGGVLSNPCSTTPADVTAWHLYSASYDATGHAAALYVDGSSVATASPTIARSTSYTLTGGLLATQAASGVTPGVDLYGLSVWQTALDAGTIANQYAQRLIDMDDLLCRGLATS